MARLSHLRIPEGVLVLTGYGLRLAVERGHLTVEHGMGRERRADRFSRVEQDLKRIVVIGHSGIISLDAIAWLHGVGVPLIHLDHDGRVYFVSSPAARGLAQLRRAQARAADTERGVAISRDLVATKIERQLNVLDQVPDGELGKPTLHDAIGEVRQARTVKEIRDWEARAARSYWQTWRDVPIQFQQTDARRRPAHWQVFGSRYSPLAGYSPRKAINPANAILNYLYAILEAEATIAALATRLDPTLGFLHADRVARASVACDLMEPVRPTVDALALSLFRERVFTKDDVFERHDGHCRLLPPLTQRLAATASLWARYVWPVADGVARALVVPKSKGRNIVPGIRMPGLGSTRRPRGRTAVVRAFDDVPSTSWADYEKPASGWKGMRPSQRVFAANRAWDQRVGRSNPEEYRRRILPKLATAPIQQLIAVTGLSKTSCSQIRCGRKVPHPRHWKALAELALKVR